VAVATPRVERDELRQARERRQAVAADELPLGDDALDLVKPVRAEAHGSTVDLTDTASLIRAVDEPDLSPTPEPLADEPASHEHHHPAAKRDLPEEPAVEAPRPARKKGRASVPSWDEIMFGGGRSD